MERRRRAIGPLSILSILVLASGVAAADPGTSSSPAFPCAEGTTGCAGPLVAGAHASTQFDGPFTFSVPDGWTNIRANYRSYQLQSSQATDSEFIVWSHAAPDAQTSDCGPAREPGVGTMTEDWLGYLTHHPGLEVTAPVTSDLGGRTLTSVRVSVLPTWAGRCPDNTDPALPLVTDTEDPPTRSHLASGEVFMGFVDVGDEAIVIWVDASGGVSLDAMLALAQPVIDSLRFSGVDGTPGAAIGSANPS